MDDFVTRLNQLFDYLQITHIELAEKMGIQRTSFNHLLSGRNKPGFEFWVKLHACYPSVNLNWLINGAGSITVDSTQEISVTENISTKSKTNIDLFTNIFNNPEMDTSHLGPIIEKPELANEKLTKYNKEETIERLIIIYSDGKMVELKAS